MSLLTCYLHKFTRRSIWLSLISGFAFISAGAAIHAAEGVLDPAFGNSGTQIIQVAAQQRDFARAVAVQPNGKIVVGGELGEFSLNTNRSVLMRLNADGSLDPTFGSGGKIINSGQLHLPALAIQPDGKIVTAGATTVLGITLDFAIVRYNADGSLDQTFGNGGYAVNGAGNAESLLLQPDGKILLVGFLPIVRNGSDYLLARFNSDGSPDQTFGNAGRVTTSFSGQNSSDKALAAALQPDGKIIATGYGAGVSAVLVRYNSNGSVDTSFGLDGSVLTPNFGAVASRILLQPDGKFIIGGGGFVLGRYNPNGTTDQSFGTGGKVSGGFGSGSGFLYALAAQLDGKLLAGGSVSYTGTGESVFALSRYTTTGSLDPTFGINGFVLTNLTQGTLDESFSLALQPDGRAVLAGYAAEPGGSYDDFALARYIIDDSPLLSAVSWRSNSASGEAYGLTLPLVGRPAVECRRGRVEGEFQVTYNFRSPVTFRDAQVTPATGRAAMLASPPTVSSDRKSVTLNLSVVSNAQTLTMRLSAVSDGTTTRDITVPMSILIGDTNGDGIVNSGDALLTRSHSGETLDASNWRLDLNSDGFINSGDGFIVRQNSGNAIAP